jgi:hypothetical protein
MKNLHLLLCASGILALVAQADASTLYGASSAGGPGELYILNPATGAMIQDVGPLNDLSNVNYPITGLAFHPTTGVLYGSTGNAGSVDALLVTINPASGLVTPIGSFNAGPVNSGGTPTTMADLAFDLLGNLYGVASIGGPNLYTINLLTGQATLVGNNGVSTSTTGGGLAINAGLFYGTPTSSRFGTYDSGTGAFTLIANPVKPAGGGYGALDFDENGILYGLNVGSGSPPLTHLVTINTADGVVTDLGLSVPSLDAIAFSVVPEPGTFTIFAVSMVGMIFTLRRRK